MVRLFLSAGAFFAGLGVMFGAFGAHALEGRVTSARVEAFETGARYQMYHALGLLAVAWISSAWPSWQITWSGYLFIAGILIFSGSLYILVLTDTPWLGAVTPLGGLSFIAGWILLLWAAVSHVR